jgi:uncharacterized protein
MALLESDESIRHLLISATSIGLVGLSDKPHRDSYQVARFLKEHGYTIIPVNPQLTSVLGLPAYANLQSTLHVVDIVDIFRQPKYTAVIVQSAIVAKAKAVWFQFDTYHAPSAARSLAAGLDVVADRCIMVEYVQLMAEDSHI